MGKTLKQKVSSDMKCHSRKISFFRLNRFKKKKKSQASHQGYHEESLTYFGRNVKPIS